MKSENYDKYEFVGRLKKTQKVLQEKLKKMETKSRQPKAGMLDDLFQEIELKLKISTILEKSIESIDKIINYVKTGQLDSYVECLNMIIMLVGIKRETEADIFLRVIENNSRTDIASPDVKFTKYLMQEKQMMACFVKKAWKVSNPDGTLTTPSESPEIKEEEISLFRSTFSSYCYDATKGLSFMFGTTAAINLASQVEENCDTILRYLNHLDRQSAVSNLDLQSYSINGKPINLKSTFKQNVIEKLNRLKSECAEVTANMEVAANLLNIPQTPDQAAEFAFLHGMEIDDSIDLSSEDAAKLTSLKLRMSKDINKSCDELIRYLNSGINDSHIDLFATIAYYLLGTTKLGPQFMALVLDVINTNSKIIASCNSDSPSINNIMEQQIAAMLAGNNKEEAMNTFLEYLTSGKNMYNVVLNKDLGISLDDAKRQEFIKALTTFESISNAPKEDKEKPIKVNTSKAYTKINGVDEYQKGGQTIKACDIRLFQHLLEANCKPNAQEQMLKQMISYVEKSVPEVRNSLVTNILTRLDNETKQLVTKWQFIVAHSYGFSSQIEEIYFLANMPYDYNYAEEEIDKELENGVNDLYRKVQVAVSLTSIDNDQERLAEKWAEIMAKGDKFSYEINEIYSLVNMLQNNSEEASKIYDALAEQVKELYKAIKKAERENCSGENATAPAIEPSRNRTLPNNPNKK